MHKMIRGTVILSMTLLSATFAATSEANNEKRKSAASAAVSGKTAEPVKGPSMAETAEFIQSKLSFGTLTRYVNVPGVISVTRYRNMKTTMEGCVLKGSYEEHVETSFPGIDKPGTPPGKRIHNRSFEMDFAAAQAIASSVRAEDFKDSEVIFAYIGLEAPPGAKPFQSTEDSKIKAEGHITIPWQTMTYGSYKEMLKTFNDQNVVRAWNHMRYLCNAPEPKKELEFPKR